ncbi:hypothetical protein [Lapillicoccus jejuensis]|uniref:Uncharacterized protein n=1 Tax=Lapillicoccus jejuensis TaxID=402171 RepID=A0A542E0E3_9MICO|nr:hypothetical protein [Lapillicoccus jejuensis]TQJ08644.1 hypothetical protein FB458_1735 [Lapillicoccus jejuensis]
MTNDPTEIHDRTDSVVEDRLRRLLDDEGARFRAGYEPPSFDDAVRRLALPGDEGAWIDDPHEAPPVSTPRVDWWRPALIAAAVLVLVGGVVGVALRSGSVHGLPADGPGGAPRLTAPPAGFHLVEGAPAAGVLDATASLTSASSGDTSSVTYVGPRALPSGEHETLVLTATRASQPLVDLPDDVAGGIGTSAGVLGLVRGHVATVRTGSCAGVSGCQSIDVAWAETADEGITLSYAGPSGSISGTLGFAEVMAAAESLDDGSGTPDPGATTRTGEAVLPQEVRLGGRRLQLWTTTALRGAEILGRIGGPTFVGTSVPAWGSGEISYCDPVDVPMLTAQDADHVEVTVGQYVTQVPTRSQLHPCPAVPPTQRPLAPTRWVVLGDTLADRRVVDGTTKATVEALRDLVG